MEKTRFAVAGSGWRALFYVRVAKLFPQRYVLTGVLCHTPERAQAFAAQYGVPTCTQLEELLDAKPEWVVSCVSKSGMTDMVTRLLTLGVPTLSETPLAMCVEDLLKLHETARRTGTLLEVAEQYFLYPTHQARHAVIASGLLGRVTACTLSVAHEYHGINLLRWYLGDAGGTVCLRARRVLSPLTVTGGRGGVITSGEMGEEIRVLAQLTAPDGRLGVYDFSSVQYHSAIRSSHVHIRGTRGELFDDAASFLTPENRPQCSALCVHRDGMTGTIRAIDFEGERVYRNPLGADAALNEDEIAVCQLMERMARSVRGGQRHMPLSYAFRDSYMACLLREAALADGEACTQPMPWDV